MKLWRHETQTLIRPLCFVWSTLYRHGLNFDFFGDLVVVKNSSSFNNGKWSNICNQLDAIPSGFKVDQISRKTWRKLPYVIVDTCFSIHLKHCFFVGTGRILLSLTPQFRSFQNPGMQIRNSRIEFTEKVELEQVAGTEKEPLNGSGMMTDTFCSTCILVSQLWSRSTRYILTYRAFKKIPAYMFGEIVSKSRSRCKCGVQGALDTSMRCT